MGTMCSHRFNNFDTGAALKRLINCISFPVHCSAGIGRSGTLILVDSSLVMAEMGEELSLSSVMETLMNMRTYRMGLIQTEDQLRFIVDAIVQGMKQLGLEQGEIKTLGV